MDQKLGEQFFEGFFAGLFLTGRRLCRPFHLIMSAYVAAPAIASILLVWAARRPLLERSMLAACVAGLVLTFAVGGVLIYGSRINRPA